MSSEQKAEIVPDHEKVRVCVRNPYISTYTFKTSLSSNCSILQLKQHLSTNYLSQPPSKDQKIIYLGKVLSDSQQLGELYAKRRQMAIGAPPSSSSSSPSSSELIFHLALKKDAKDAFRALEKELPAVSGDSPTSSTNSITPTAPTATPSPSPLTRSSSSSSSSSSPSFSLMHPSHVALPGQLGFYPLSPPGVPSPMYTMYHSPYANSPVPFHPYSQGQHPAMSPHHMHTAGLHVHVPPPHIVPGVMPAAAAVVAAVPEQLNIPANQAVRRGPEIPAAGPGVVPAAAAGRQAQLNADNGEQPAGHGEHIGRFINFTLALKLVAMVMLFSQGDGWTSSKTLFLFFLAFVSYIHQVGILAMFLRKCRSNRRPVQQQQGNPPEVPAERQNGDDIQPVEHEEDADEAPVVAPPRTGVIVNIEKFVLGLFASLFPGWRHQLHVE